MATRRADASTALGTVPLADLAVGLGRAPGRLGDVVASLTADNRADSNPLNANLPVPLASSLAALSRASRAAIPSWTSVHQAACSRTEHRRQTYSGRGRIVYVTYWT